LEKRHHQLFRRGIVNHNLLVSRLMSDSFSKETMTTPLKGKPASRIYGSTKSLLKTLQRSSERGHSQGRASVAPTLESMSEIPAALLAPFCLVDEPGSDEVTLRECLEMAHPNHKMEDGSISRTVATPSPALKKTTPPVAHDSGPMTTPSNSSQVMALEIAISERNPRNGSDEKGEFLTTRNINADLRSPSRKYCGLSNQILAMN